MKYRWFTGDAKIGMSDDMKKERPPNDKAAYAAAQPDADQLYAFLSSRTGAPRRFNASKEMWPDTPALGYRLQQAVHDALIEKGSRLAGYKIGCISPESQQPFQLDEPIYARIYDQTRFKTLGQALSLPLINPSIECEIAFRLGSSPQPDTVGDISEEELTEAITEAFIACEVIDNRYDMTLSQIGTAALLADDFLHAAFVLGPSRTEFDRTLFQNLRARAEIDGVVSTETPPFNLSPLAALRWLVKKVHGHGGRLEAGQIVMTGSLLRPGPVRKGSAVRIEVEGFGHLEA